MLSMDARRERRTSAALALILGLIPVVGCASTKDEPKSLSVGYTELMWLGDRAEVEPPIHNDGTSTIELLSASVPDVPDAKVWQTAKTWVLDRDRLMPVAGLKIRPNESEWVTIVVPARCPSAPKITSLELRMRVDGREVTQVAKVPRIVARECS
jgi:hypothetical protein